jgi:hypothetical protein
MPFIRRHISNVVMAMLREVMMPKSSIFARNVKLFIGGPLSECSTKLVPAYFSFQTLRCNKSAAS